jgi:hypothetical protein
MMLGKKLQTPKKSIRSGSIVVNAPPMKLAARVVNRYLFKLCVLRILKKKPLRISSPTI